MIRLAKRLLFGMISILKMHPNTIRMPMDVKYSNVYVIIDQHGIILWLKLSVAIIIRLIVAFGSKMNNDSWLYSLVIITLTKIYLLIAFAKLKREFVLFRSIWRWRKYSRWFHWNHGSSLYTLWRWTWCRWTIELNSLWPRSCRPWQTFSHSRTTCEQRSHSSSQCSTIVHATNFYLCITKNILCKLLEYLSSNMVCSIG